MRGFRLALLAVALGSVTSPASAAGFENVVIASSEGADASETTFAPTVEKIYLSAEITGEVSGGSKITVAWIALDTGGAAPDNYKIDESSFDVGSLDNHLDASLSKPNAGFPVGQYEADIAVDGKVEEKVAFTVK